MPTFLEIARHQVVDLAAPWDPGRVIEEYVGDRVEDRPSPSAIDALQEGAILRFDMDQHRIGAVEAEMHINVLEARQLEVDLGAAVSLKWWLWPLAIAFRGRLRRWLNGRIDQMLDELAEDDRATGMNGEQVEPVEESPAAPPKGVSWTLQVLAPSGDPVYERTAGSPVLDW